MWKKGKLYVSAMLLLEELHFMMTCSKLPTKSLVLEQVLERVVKWVLLNAHSVWQSYPWNTSQNCLLVAIALAMIVSSSTFG
jgi:hypothetical protein